jgi:hypothetical protein
MLRKDKTVSYKHLSADEVYFKDRGNLYMIPKEAVNSIAFADKPNNPHAELIYVEGNPIPVFETSDTKMSGETFLEELVIENVLKSTGQPEGFFFEVLKDYLKSPGKLLMLTVVGIIVLAVLSQMFKVKLF